MLEAVNPPGGDFPGLSQAVIVRQGNLMFLSGQTPVDQTGQVVEGNFEAQVGAVFANIGRILEAAGVGFESVVRMTYYVANYAPERIAVIKKVRGPLLTADCPPASILIPVAELYDPAIEIEIECIVVLPSAT
jgi:enamine deaminase RidA (YjgF/YER057c/UK114 family)